ncbi:hypothetical protein [Natronobacterium gregoryi]|uniref:SWIM-type domain-containing protein n=2 Tax=Natronobacterium gregoryi TaxID=44930 RepID=L0AIS0_NATGS|nr:hypothetical protein [Natronobacterium gregoryi]AFZ73067.1 hypothetical protein Natgr_1882 [Natronobacterium gregoryi SP2]ELY70832.1 hypothetical protein C490_06062 [Natronobacterium gregoryi SP2]PLK20412.1 hypothetical protein CYV19_09805 [Natronobacterium gregoryi SP2]SFI62034.1 hypothetical protein SAMN05443661_102199 [Natronobacterium gregoryi]
MAVATTDQDTVDADVDELDERALTEYLTVLEDQGRVRGCPDLYLVVSESGREYLVNSQPWACECADHQYRDRLCKHIRRVAFAIGERPVPRSFDQDDVAGELGEHVDVSPRWSR